MALIIFRCRDYADIPMLSSHARAMFERIGLELKPQGVIRGADLAHALEALTQAIRDDEAAEANSQTDHRSDISREPQMDNDADDDAPTEPTISLKQRAYPFMQMLRAAMANDEDVYWGF